MMTMQDMILRAMLAREFGREITGYLDPRQLALANERNAYSSWHTGICHTHDFADTNMAMDTAFSRVLGRSALPDEAASPEQHEADCALWSAAWGIAQSRRFWGDPQEAQFWEWVATRESCADLGQQMSDEILQGVPGLIYEGGYIEMPELTADELAAHERSGPRPHHRPRYHLHIERSEWDSDDLEELERILFFEWVLPNGYLADQREDDPAPGVGR